MIRQWLLALSLAIPAGIPQAASEPSAGLWLDVPYIHQERDGCGSAAVAMLLQYWNSKDVTVPAGRSNPREIQRQLYSPEARGIYASAIQKYLRESGFDVYAFRGDWKDLSEHIGKGRPLLASLKLGRGAELHYVVIVGQDSARDAVLLNDSARGKLFRVGRPEFEKEWRATGNWTLLAVPKRPG